MYHAQYLFRVRGSLKFDRFLSILEASWAPSWRHVDAMLATKPKKNDFENKATKKALKQGGGGARRSTKMKKGRLLGVLNSCSKQTFNTEIQRAKKTPSQLALWLTWFPSGSYMFLYALIWFSIILYDFYVFASIVIIIIIIITIRIY